MSSGRWCHFSCAVFVRLHTSLASMVIYCRHRHSALKMITEVFFCVSKCVILILCRTPDIFSHISRTTLQQSSMWRKNIFQQNFPQFFFHGSTAPRGPRPPNYRGFMITIRHATVGRTPLDEWSARCRDLYLTTHNNHKRHPCPQRDSNPPSQQVSGCRPKP